MKLIVNADDFGYSRAVNFGIVDACRYGLVRSTTIMANMPGFEHAVSLAGETPELGVGVHLTLTSGSALTGVSSLTDASGRFLSQHVLSAQPVDVDAVQREWEAQLARVYEVGLSPTHLDSHHHCHMWPAVLPLFLMLADRLGLPVRLTSKDALPGGCPAVRSPDVFSMGFYGDTATADGLIALLERFSSFDGILELMGHPGYLDADLLAGSTYAIPRVEELAALCAPETAAYVRSAGIELIGFSALSV